MILLILIYPVYSMDFIVGNPSCNFCSPNEWNNTYGGKMDDMGYSVAETAGGYFVAGVTKSFGKGNYDAWLIKVDRNGNEIWNKTYGGKNEDGIYDILVTQDGCIVAGKTKSFGKGSYDAWLIKVDSNGNEIWNKTYGGEGNEVAYSICPTHDGYLIAGIIQPFGKDYDAWLIKMDNNGNEIWNKTYGSTRNDYVYSIKECNEGYVMAGTTEFSIKDYDAWLIKVDNNGNEIWNKTYGGEASEIATDVAVGKDGYIMSGNFMDLKKRISDAMIIKVDNNGNEIWNKAYGGAYMDNLNCILADNDSIVAAGYYGMLSNKGGAWIVRIDENGSILWNKTIHGKGDDFAWSFIKSKGGYLLVGSSSAYSRGGYDVWLIKVYEPKIEIEIKGGFGINIFIKNLENESITNVEFNVAIMGFILFGKVSEGNLDLPPGEIKLHIPVFGFGNAKIRIRIGNVEKSANCFVFGPFVLIR